MARKQSVPEGRTQSWYLKYRPRIISELDQQSVKLQLASLVEAGRIPHALLFAGPKGTGKTSSARIIAKVLNCEKNGAGAGKLSEPCNECDSCVSINNGTSFSVMELDAASNRGIEDIRAIREAAKLSVPGKHRVYIIDEAHMLTLEAASALLKTLEEPPPHVVFILATTEGSRLPDTIRSRVVTISFSKAASEEILRALKRVVNGEGLEIEQGKLEQIADIAGGSFRDAIKILEQVVYGGLDLSKLSNNSSDNLIASLTKKDLKESLAEISRIEASGANIKDFNVSLLERLREIMLINLGVKESNAGEKIPKIEIGELKQLIQIFTDSTRFINLAPIPIIPLELAVMEWCGEPKGAGSRGLRAVKSVDSDPLEPASDKNNIRSQNVSSPFKGGISDEVWKKILDAVRAKNHTVAALLRSANPEGFVDGKLRIIVFYQFHKDRLGENKNIAVVEEAVGQVLGGEARVEFILGESPKKKQSFSAKREAKVENIESVAEEIFGGKVEN